MSCVLLASTGSSVAAPIAVGGVLVVAGVLLVFITRGRRARTAVVTLLLIGGAFAVGITGESPAHAATPTCTSSPQPSPGAGTGGVLTIIQTSTITGLAPGVTPAAITGTITNSGATSVVVAAVTVRIAAVTKAAGAAAGTCDASDYILLDADMPVGRTLAPGESIGFAGALIGFNDTTVNQDSCRRAVVALSYVSS